MNDPAVVLALHSLLGPNALSFSLSSLLWQWPSDAACL